MDEVNTSVNSSVAGGLQGLRELIRAQKTTTTTDGSNKNDDSKKLTRSRGRSKSSGGSADRMDLPFVADDIVYAEIIDKKGDDSDVKLFVDSSDRLLIYTSRVYPGQEEEYRNAAKYMARTGKDMKRSMAGGVEILVNKSARLTVDDEGILYDDRYRIVCANEKVSQRVAEIINDNDKQQLTAKEEKTVTNKNSGDGNSNHHNGNSNNNNHNNFEKFDQELIDKIIEVQKVASRTGGGRIEPRDLMKVFLTVRQASSSLAERLLKLDHETIDCLIDELRRMRALGPRQDDGTYPILIKDIKELGQNHEYKLQSSADNFRSVVHTELIKGKEVYYDLDELSMVKIADEFMAQIGIFCRTSNSEQLAKLWALDSQRVSVSEVLRCLSADRGLRGLNVGDYEQFNSYVTKYMLAAGWLSANHSDGYPWMAFQVKKTDGLKADILRYIITNSEWIKATYRTENLSSLASQIGNLEFTNSKFDAEKIRIQAIQAIGGVDLADASDEADGKPLSDSANTNK